MKRVVPFLDMFDEIPDNSKYLYSRKVEISTEETEEQKNARPLSNTLETHAVQPAITYIHYYEVDGMDFEEIMESGFGKKNSEEKIKEFMQKYKLLIK